MFQIVLFQPEIPPNAGNIMRLCANTGSTLHLVRPLGFRIDDRTLSRAGMDYRSRIDMHIHVNWQACLEALGQRKLFFATTKGGTCYNQPRYTPGDVLVFGSETAGLPAEILDQAAENQRIRIPMMGSERSINLANSVSIIVYEAWRQNNFEGGS